MSAEDQKFWDQVYFTTLRECLSDMSRKFPGNLQYHREVESAAGLAAAAANAALKHRNFPR